MLTQAIKNKSRQIYFIRLTLVALTLFFFFLMYETHETKHSLSIQFYLLFFYMISTFLVASYIFIESEWFEIEVVLFLFTMIILFGFYTEISDRVYMEISDKTKGLVYNGVRFFLLFFLICNFLVAIYIFIKWFWLGMVLFSLFTLITLIFGGTPQENCSCCRTETLSDLSLFLLFSNFLVIIYLFAKSDSLFWIEMVLSLFTLAILTGMTVSLLPNSLQRVKVSELFQLIPMIKMQWVEYYSYHGKWPVQEEFKQMEMQTTGVYTEHISLQQGALSGTLKDTGFILTFRLATTEKQPKVVPWVCGDAEPPEGFIAYGKNLTTLPPAYLPHGCHK